MIRIVLPTPRAVAADGQAKSRCAALLRCVRHMVRAEAWQTTAALHDFRFDPSTTPDPPHTFTTVAGRLARGLYGYWDGSAEPVPRTIASDGATETTWPKRIGVPLFFVEAQDEQRRVYLSKDGFVTARFAHRQMQVWRHGRYTTGVLGGRVAKAVAEAIGKETLEPATTIRPWPVDLPCASPYSVLARTLLAMAATVLDAGAPELRARMAAIDFAELMDDAALHLTVDEVHAL